MKLMKFAGDRTEVAFEALWRQNDLQTGGMTGLVVFIWNGPHVAIGQHHGRFGTGLGNVLTEQRSFGTIGALNVPTSQLLYADRKQLC